MAVRGDTAEPDLVFREHWRVLVVPVAVLFAAIAVGAFAASRAPVGSGRPWARIAVLVITLAVVGRWSVLPWLRWLTDRHIVADGRLVVRTGVWTQEGRAIGLARIADVTVVQDGVLERVLGIGTLTVVPDDDREPMRLIGLPRAADAQLRLLRMVDLARDAEFHAARHAAQHAAQKDAARTTRLAAPGEDAG